MKCADVIIPCLELLCPHCGENQVAANGSHMLERSDIPCSVYMNCISCDVKFKIPARVRKWKRGEWELE